jgi:hypothetical protein
MFAPLAIAKAATGRENPAMWQAAFSAFVVLSLVNGGLAQKTATTNTFQNARVKRAEDPDRQILFEDSFPEVSGMWVPESKDPAKTLVFPEQVKIVCTHSDLTCRELTVPLESIGGLVFIGDIEEKIWQVTSWDQNGLLASYDADPHATAASERCHRHVLSMSFRSGAVSTSDIPTHEKGCEMFPETDSYKLVRGQYYVDTTPGNDADRPVRPAAPHSQK